MEKLLIISIDPAGMKEGEHVVSRNEIENKIKLAIPEYSILEIHDGHDQILTQLNIFNAH